MRILTAHEPIPAEARGVSLALGNFDGAHLGHQAVIAQARKPGAPLAVSAFRPHPRRHFRPDGEPFRLQTDAQQARVLADLGVDCLVVFGFDAAFAAQTPEEFCRNALAPLEPSSLTVGPDFRFGKDRAGDVAALRAYGFHVEVAQEVCGPSGRISSSAVRAALREGDAEGAAALLGRPFAIEGIVARGLQRGRTIDFPTLNVDLGDYVRPAFGVYVTQTRLGDAGDWLGGVANLGVRPTVEDAPPAPLLETHLFDVRGDFYGQRAETRLLHFLRPERRFESFAALSAQIAADARDARAWLAAQRP